MKTIYIVCLLGMILGLSGSVLAEESAHTWVFGSGAGLQWSYSDGSYTPLPLDGFLQNSVEATSSISDAAGNLLLYTDGVSLWDGDNNDISFEVSLEGSQTSTHGTIIIPYPGWPRRYIILTQGLNEDSGIHYTVYNRIGETGYFETAAPIPLVGSILPTGFIASEKMAVIPGVNPSEVTVVFVSDIGELYLSRLTADGFSRAQNILPAAAQSSTIGQLSFTQDGRRMALANYLAGSVRLMAFDPSTNLPQTDTLSVFEAVNENELIYSLAFSPSGDRLFAGIINQFEDYDRIIYFDLIGTELGAPIELQVQAPEFSYGQMRLGLDGRIYVTQPSNSGRQGGTEFLAIIPEPDAAVPVLTRDALLLAGTGLGRLGFSTHPIWLTTPCGNGLLEWGEGCDDGNRDSGDGCSPMCQPEGCSDRFLNGSETDADCGGDCPSCWDGYGCQTDADCFFSTCVASDGGSRCESHCTNGVIDGDESDVDCGGELCLPCEEAELCLMDSDCVEGTRCDIFADVSRCATGVPTCDDGLLNGLETGRDCGGPQCGPCTLGFPCFADADCVEGATCGERLGGFICLDVCDNGIKDPDEADVDCGGSCDLCALGLGCSLDADCASGLCDTGRLEPICVQTDFCQDGVIGVEETGIDCGGDICLPCGSGQGCLEDSDCQAGLFCFDETCLAQFDLVDPIGPGDVLLDFEDVLLEEEEIDFGDYILTGGGAGCQSSSPASLVSAFCVFLLALRRKRGSS